jgi:hypothetical protein
LGIEKLKLKAFGGSPLARRISMEPAAVQRNRKHIMDAEVYSLWGICMSIFSFS